MKLSYSIFSLLLASGLAAAAAETAGIGTKGPSTQLAKTVPGGQPPIFSGDGSNFSLAPAVTYSFLNGTYVDSVAIGDVTGDGLNDVVATIYRSDNDPASAFTVVVFAQGANGLLTEVARRATGIGGLVSQMPAVLVDLDHAAGLDIVIGWNGGLVRMLADPNNILGTPQSYLTQEAAVVLAPLDVSGDGHEDIVSLAWTPAGRTYLSDGVGGFASSQPFETSVGGYNKITHRDINGDGREDVVVGSWQSPPPQIRVHLQDGLGGFTAGPTITAPDNAVLPVNGLGLADYNADNRVDLAFTWGGNLPNAGLRVMYQDAQGGFSSYQDFVTFDSPGDMRAADINRDGRDDVVVNHGSSMGIFLQPPGGGLLAEHEYPFPFTNLSINHGHSVGDVNGDGCPDVVVTGPYSNGITVLTGRGCSDAIAADGFE